MQVGILEPSLDHWFILTEQLPIAKNMLKMHGL